jgi:hypothetical protein
VKLHPIPPGLYCVPSVLVALTGADIESVIIPGLNRHSGYKHGLFDTVSSATMNSAAKVLEELGYRVRPYKYNAAAGRLNAHIATWARRSTERWPGRAIMVTTSDHCLLIHNGIVYDTHSPHGEAGATHPFAKTTVTNAYLVEEPR